MIIRKSYIPWFLLLLFLTSCVPESDQPLSDLATATADSRLSGAWVGRVVDGDGPVWIHFIEGEKSMMEILMVCPEEKKGLEAYFYKMHPTTVGNQTFMNLKSFLPKSGLSFKVQEELKYPEPGGYMLVKYAISGEGVLTIWLLDNNQIVEAVQKGQLRGEVKPDRYITEVTIKDAPGNVASFLEKADPEKLFKLFMVCRRADVKPPEVNRGEGGRQ